MNERKRRQEDVEMMTEINALRAVNAQLCKRAGGVRRLRRRSSEIWSARRRSERRRSAG